MITAVDSSSMLDVLTNDPVHGISSLNALRNAANLGPLIVCPIVWAEVRGYFATTEDMQRSFAGTGVLFDPFDRECADLAGEMWREYRRRGGTRARILADFFIGAHAQRRGGRLISRDRGFYRRYFYNVHIVGYGNE